MLQPPTKGEFQALELLWKHVHNASRAQGYSVSTLRSNITHNQIEIGYDRSGTPNPHKSSSKTATSRKLDFLFRLYARKYAKSTTWTLKVKNPEHSHAATENIMAHPAFKKFNEKETSQISQISESLPRQIQAKLCSQRESDSPGILQDIYNQVKKIKKDKLQGRRPIDSLIETLKEETFVWSSARDAEEVIFHVKNFPPHICALNGKVSHYALQMAFDNFKTKFPHNEKCTNKYNNYQSVPCKHKTQKAFTSAKGSRYQTSILNGILI
ncbi:hypothetical protein O181_047141 [Austropuccinia psidii MF-1]|uniref:Uncharacterized protein n=1 Tax=Austropuccinia psidii MF-1 TaxID=1389203 RepID=A0A9Q3DVI9_9BASI|nr:hypothetical protein [Austropuccinia psidii MF-1]